MRDQPAVVVSDVKHSYRMKSGQLDVLNGVTFSVPTGSVVSLLGPSGCGKSTLLRIILGLDRPSSGAVQILGKVVNGIPSQSPVSAILQRPNLMPWRTALRNVELPLELRRYGRAERTALATEVLRAVGLEKFLDYPPRSLSGGMRQRVALARALVTSPSVLLLDEPFNSIDRITREQLQLETLRHLKRYNCTSLLVTHDLDEAAFLSSCVIVLSTRPARVVAIEPMPSGDRDSAYRESPSFIESVLRLRRILAQTAE